jgi:hypothetical protein
MTDLFFYGGLSFILTHEMDAVRCREWRIFPLTSRLTGPNGYLVFTALHVPLYLLLFNGLFANPAPDPALIRGLDLFFIVHVVLHLLFRKHPENRFTSAFSWLLIAGAGLCGLLDLLFGGR